MPDPPTWIQASTTASTPSCRAKCVEPVDRLGWRCSLSPRCCWPSPLVVPYSSGRASWIRRSYPESSTRLAYGLDGDIYLADWDGANPVLIADGTPAFADCGHLWGEGSMWSPDGRYVGYRSAWNDRCSGSVFIADSTGRPVASFAGGGWLLSWSPDSTRVATWVDDMQTIGIYGIDGARQALLPVPDGCADPGDFDPVWSPDGLSVVIKPCEVPLDGAPPRRLPDDDPRSHLGWSYSREGRRFAYVTYVLHDSLAITDAGGAEVLILTGAADPSTGVSQVAYPQPRLVAHW